MLGFAEPARQVSWDPDTKPSMHMAEWGVIWLCCFAACEGSRLGLPLQLLEAKAPEASLLSPLTNDK